MARNGIGMTCTDDKVGKSVETNAGPSTSNKPSNETQKANTVIEKLKLLREANTVPLTSNKPLIQKVPEILSSCYGENDCKRYFKPTSVAIGPLSHKGKTDKDSRMERGEKCKLKLAAMFIKDGKEEDFYKNVEKEIDSLKKCYNLEEIQEWSDKDLAWMFLVDGCALLQFIALDVCDKWELFSDNDPVSIEKVDFFLLENQLPYRLLEILMGSFIEFSREDLKEKLRTLFKELITEFINRSFLSLSPRQKHQIQNDYFPPHPPHLLDLLRRRLTKKIDHLPPIEDYHGNQVWKSKSISAL